MWISASGPFETQSTVPRTVAQPFLRWSRQGRYTPAKGSPDLHCPDFSRGRDPWPEVPLHLLTVTGISTTATPRQVNNRPTPYPFTIVMRLQPASAMPRSAEHQDDCAPLRRADTARAP